MYVSLCYMSVLSNRNGPANKMISELANSKYLYCMFSVVDI